MGASLLLPETCAERRAMKFGRWCARRGANPHSRLEAFCAPTCISRVKFNEIRIIQKNHHTLADLARPHSTARFRTIWVKGCQGTVLVASPTSLT